MSRRAAAVVVARHPAMARYATIVNNLRGVEFPGGFVEPGENFKQAALRELCEETGLVAHCLTDLGEVTSPRGTRVRVFVATFQSRSMRLYSSDEGRARWSTQRELLSRYASYPHQNAVIFRRYRDAGY